MAQSNNNLPENTEMLTDIQFLLIMYQAYIDDMDLDKTKFNELCVKYHFDTSNLYKGFENLCC